MIMKTKISHRFLSLFAAVLVAFSLISTVALAAEIQPRISTCPNCNSERTSYGYTWAPEACHATVTHRLANGNICQHTQYHYYAIYCRCLNCADCGRIVELYRNEVAAWGYYCSWENEYFR